MVGAAGSQVSSPGISRGAASAKQYIPQAGIHKHLAGRVAELAEELSGCVERVDGTVTEVSPQNRAREFSERGRRRHNAPRRVEFPTRSDKIAHEIAIRAENIDLPHTSAGLSVVLGSILHGIGNVDLVSDDVNAVGSKTRRELWIRERTAQRCKVKIPIENVDFSTIEVRRQKKGVVDRRQTL